MVIATVRQMPGCQKIGKYVIPDCNPIKERLGEIMGGQVLKLRSEELIEQGIEQGIERGIERGIEQGIEQGVNQTLYSSVQDGDMLPERAAKRLNISVPELRKQMQEQGYHFPEQQPM